MTTVPIFVSSTFRDFHAERDAFHRRIRPRLDAELSHLGISVAIVDLRWGIPIDAEDSERRRTRSVLTACAREIDRCSPMIVGLVGDYYGWVPGEKYARRFFPSIAEIPKDRSVTELELRYAASRSVYSPSVFRRTILEEDAEWVDAGGNGLAELVDYCRGHTEFHDYTVSLNTQTSSDLDPFVSIVTAALRERIEGMTRDRVGSFGTSNDGSDELRGRDHERAELGALLRSGRSVVLSGPSGIGKSVLVRSVVNELVDESMAAIRHSVTAAHPSEGDLVATVALAVDHEVPIGDPASVVEPLRAALGALGRSLIVVDSAERLLDGPDRNRMRGTLRLASAAPTVVTTTSADQEVLLERAGFAVLRVAEISEDGVKQSLRHRLAGEGRELPDVALETLAAMPRSGFWLSVATDLMLSVGEEVYVRAAAHNDPDSGLASELASVAAALPGSESELVSFVLERVERQFGRSPVERLLAAIAASPGGAIDINQLHEFVGLDAGDSAQIRYALGSSVLDLSQGVWATLSHQIVARSAETRYSAASSATHHQLHQFFDRRQLSGVADASRILHHALHGGLWSAALEVLATPSASSYLTGAKQRVIVNFLRSATTRGAEDFHLAVRGCSDETAVEHLAQLLTTFESRELSIQHYRALASALLEGDFVLRQGEQNDALVGRIELVAAELARAVGDRSGAIDLAERSCVTNGRAFRADSDCESALAAHRSQFQYVRSFFRPFDTLLHETNKAAAIDLMNEIEGGVRGLELDDHGELVAAMLETKLELYARYLPTTNLGNARSALDELISIR